MKVLITGGCGFIGRNLVRSLIEGGEVTSVRVLDDLSVGRVADLETVHPVRIVKANRPIAVPTAPVELVVGDIRDRALGEKAAAGVDAIVHLAANTGVGPSVEDPRQDSEANVFGTLNCLEAARNAGVSRFVFASSGAPVGVCEPPVHEGVAPRPASPYGASKLAGEGYCSAYWHSFRVPTVALRFGNVYGPGSDHKTSVVAKFIRTALAGNPMVVYGDGSQTRDFIFIGDIVRAMVCALKAPESSVAGEVFHIATGNGVSVNELVEHLTALLSKRGIRSHIEHGERRIGDVQHSWADASKAAKFLNWRPSESLANGLAQTIDWFLSQTGSRSAAGASR